MVQAWWILACSWGSNSSRNFWILCGYHNFNVPIYIFMYLQKLWRTTLTDILHRIKRSWDLTFSLQNLFLLNRTPVLSQIVELCNIFFSVGYERIKLEINLHDLSTAKTMKITDSIVLHTVFTVFVVGSRISQSKHHRFSSWENWARKCQCVITSPQS